MTYPDHLPFLSKAVGHVPVEAGKNYHVIPEIERPDISLEQVALPDNWSTGATDFQRATLTAHNSLIGLTFASSQYPGYTDLYYFAMLPITGDNDRGMPSHEFIIGSGDGEGRLPGAVLQTNWLDKEPQNLDLLAAVDNQPQTTLPANAIKLSRSYYVELQPNHNQQYLQLSIAQQNDASQIEANVAIHVLGSGANAGHAHRNSPVGLCATGQTKQQAQ